MIRPIHAHEAALALPAMRQLRPDSPFMTGADAFAEFLRQTESEGYRLIGSFEPDRTEAAAVAGFRIMTLLYAGRTLYVDDLSTLPDARGRGHATKLLRWLEAEALRLGCVELHLDSGTHSGRYDAHRLYLKTGMNIAAFHFAKALP